MKKLFLLAVTMMLCYSMNSFAALIAFYPFNGNALDESGHKHHGQLVNVSLATDRLGNKRQAYRFDGQGYIKIESQFEEWAEGITISVWIYPTQPKTALLVNTPSIGLLAEQDNSLWFFSVQAVNAIKQNEWQHLVATIDAFGNVDFYKNGDHIKGGSSNFTKTAEAQMTLGGAFVGILDEVRIYNHALSEAQVVKLHHEEKPSEQSTSQTKAEGTYEDGYKEGRMSCISQPESCGLRYPSEDDADETVAESDEQAEPTGFNENNEEAETDNQADPADFNEQMTYPSLLSSSNVILSIPITTIEGNHTTITELVREVDALTGDIIFRFKATPNTSSSTEPYVWDIKINPTNVQKGEAQLVSWQSREQAGYSFYLYDMNDEPVNTSVFLSETCQAIGSGGDDGCLGWQNSAKRRTDSWRISTQLASGHYKIKVIIQSTNEQLLIEKYSLPFLVE
jgi:hypothetical protein